MGALFLVTVKLTLERFQVGVILVALFLVTVFLSLKLFLVRGEVTPKLHDHMLILPPNWKQRFGTTKFAN